MPFDCDRSSPPNTQECQSQYNALGALVYAAGQVTISTSHGPVVCLNASTFEHLSQHTDSLATVRSPAEAATEVRLTPREVDILSAVASEHSISVIADHRGLTTSTVSQHLVAVRRKYRVHSTAAAVRIAQAEGHI